MAEARRIAITTVGSLKKDKKPKDSAPTHRFNLPLLEPSDKTCPEFNYNDLLKSSRSANNGIVDGGEDQEDDKLKALARKFEAKYAPKLGKKQRQKLGRLEDYIDLGMGYDENDPFIDNTDAYDELVPSTLTTQLGGFYINSGKLNFKEVCNSDDGSSGSSDFDGILDTATKKRRRRLKELEKDTKRRKRILKEGEVPKRKGWKNKTDSALTPQRKSLKQPTVATLLQQHKSQQSVSVVAANVSVTPSGQTGVIVVGNGERKTPGVSDALESVMNVSRDRHSNDGGMNTGTGSSDSEFATGTPGGSEEEPKLPEGLPSDLDSLVDLIKEAAQKSEEGKCKFFSGEVNNILLNIELKTRELICSQRSMIYAHLARHLPCTKETLLKRAKKLRLDQEGGKLKEPMAKLKEAITSVMPAMLEKYNQKCMAASNCKDGVKKESNSEHEDSTASEAVEDGGKDKLREKDANHIRRKFEWNEKLRYMLLDVVRIKMKCYEVSKIRSQSAEEYIRQFLETEVNRLWPKGWMQSRILYKTSREAHSYLTNRPKKQLMAAGKKQLVPIPVMSIGEQPPVKQVTFLPNGLAGTVPASNNSISTAAWVAATKATPAKTPLVLSENYEVDSPAAAVVVSSAVSPVAVPSAHSSPSRLLNLTPPVTTAATTQTTVSTTASVAAVVSAGECEVAFSRSTADPVVTPLAKSTPKSVASASPEVTYHHVSKTSHHDSTNKHLLDPVLPRAMNSVDSITVSTLLKQSSAVPTSSVSVGGLGNQQQQQQQQQQQSHQQQSQHSLESLVGGLKFRTMDYSESLQAAALLSNPSPNDVLHQIIHASLADFPSSGSTKPGSFSLAGDRALTTTSVSQGVGVGSTYSPAKHLANMGSVSHGVEMKSPIVSSRSQVSLLKNPPSAAASSTPGLVASRSGDSGGFIKTSDSIPRTLTATAKVPLTDLQLNTHSSSSQNHGGGSGKITATYNIVGDRNSSKSGYTQSSFQSAFEFPEAIERTLQGKTSPSPTLALYPGVQAGFRKDSPSDLVLSSMYPSYGRKDTSELPHPLALSGSSFSRKELLNDQPLNFSTGRHLVQTGTPTSSSAFNNRLSPVPGTYSPMKDVSKPAHVISGIGSGRNTSSLPQPSLTASGSTRQATADSIYSSTTSHNAFATTSPVQTVARNAARVSSHASNPVPTSVNLAYGGGTGSTQSKGLSPYTGMDYNTTLSQVLNTAWRGPTSNCSPPSSSAYSRHYANMLPPVMSYPVGSSTVKLSDGSKVLPHPSPTLSRNPSQSASAFDQDSPF